MKNATGIIIVAIIIFVTIKAGPRSGPAGRAGGTRSARKGKRGRGQRDPRIGGRGSGPGSARGNGSRKSHRRDPREHTPGSCPGTPRGAKPPLPRGKDAGRLEKTTSAGKTRQRRQRSEASNRRQRRSFGLAVDATLSRNTLGVNSESAGNGFFR